MDRLITALESSRDYLKSRNELSWAEIMNSALTSLNGDDFSFVDELYSKVAPTCEVENLFITEPEKQSPPITEEQANKINAELADIINELTRSLEPYWDN